jgi:hypothetical protein
LLFHVVLIAGCAGALAGLTASALADKRRGLVEEASSPITALARSIALPELSVRSLSLRSCTETTSPP